MNAAADPSTSVPGVPDGLRRAARYLAAVAVAGAMILSACYLDVWWSARGRVYDTVEATPRRPVAVVFGAGVWDVDESGLGRPSPALTARMDEAVALFKAGKVQHLLVSGDNSRRGYDEPTIMRRLAIQGGVPAAQVTVDYAGFDTSDSCVRARRIFGVDEAVLVTQGFHIRRAIFLCRRAGLDAVGLVASEAMFTDRARLRLQVREAAAAPKAWWEGYVDPRPTYLGDFVGLVGSEHPANPDPEVDG